MGDGEGGHWLVQMEWRPAGWLVCLPLLVFPCTIKSRSCLLAPSHPGGPGKRAVNGCSSSIVVVAIKLLLLMMFVYYQLFFVAAAELSQTKRQRRWWWRQLYSVAISSSAGNHAVGISAAESPPRLRSAELDTATSADDRRIWCTAAGAEDRGERSAGTCLHRSQRHSSCIQDSCGQ